MIIIIIVVVIIYPSVLGLCHCYEPPGGIVISFYHIWWISFRISVEPINVRECGYPNARRRDQRFWNAILKRDRWRERWVIEREFGGNEEDCICVLQCCEFTTGAIGYTKFRLIARSSWIGRKRAWEFVLWNIYAGNKY